MPMLARLQSSVPVASKAGWFMHAAGAGAILVPGFGLIPRAFADLHSAGLISSGLEHGVPWVLGGGLGLLYGVKAMEIFKKPPVRGVWIGRMFIEEKHFWTSFMITGRPGSGKTSGVIMPVAEQIIRLYTGPDHIQSIGADGQATFEENDLARIGGLVLEVKGEFYEMIAYLLHECRRNVYEDFFIIRPDSRIPVGQFRDKKNGNLFYLNALPCSSGSDAGILLSAAQDAMATPMDQRIRADIFSCQPNDFNAALDRLRSLTFPVRDKDLCFIGWRREGDQLVRVSHTPEFDKPSYLLDANKQKQYVPLPENLQFQDRVLFSNDLIYNLIDPSVGANEAAEKLTKMAAMAGRGESGKDGGNSYWYNNAQKLIASCIALHRAVNPKVPATCAHVYNMVANDKDLHEETKKLDKELIALRALLAKLTDPDKKVELESRTIAPLLALTKYFAGEWVGLDEKTKGIIKTVVSNTFANFVLDPALNETFCGVPTFHFSETLQKGRFFCFVPGQQYKNLAKVIGTGLKLDFQSNALARLDRSDFNKRRALLALTDECWNWVISGGQGGGDAHFLSLCRQPRVINLLATQNYSQFVGEIGRDATNNYLGQFGVFVWLQNFDKLTNEDAEKLMEIGKRESLKASESDGVAKMSMEWKEKKLFTAQDFISLGADEAICFNGGLTRDMAEKTKMPKSDLTHPKSAPKIARFLRQFFAGSLEQALWRQNRMERVDPRPQAPTVPTSEQLAANPGFVAPKVAPPPTGGSLPPATPQSPEKGKGPLDPTVTPAPTPPPPPPPAAPENRPVQAPPPSGANRNLRWHHKPQNDAAAPAPPVSSDPAAQPSTTSNLTPKIVDDQSAEYLAVWRRLTVAAADVVGEDDDRGLKKWLRELTQQVRAGSLHGGNHLTGPNGYSVGDKSLTSKAAPGAGPVLEKLESQERAPHEARLQHHSEQQFNGKSGLPHGSGSWLD